MAFASTVAGICRNTAEAMNIVSVLTASPFLFVVIGTLSTTVEFMRSLIWKCPHVILFANFVYIGALNPSTGARIAFLEFFVIRQKKH